MPTEHASPQRIARLTPLPDVLSFLDSKVAPVAPRSVDAGDALGYVLAKDCIAPSALPPRAIALRDGFAVRSDATTDASSYAPAILSETPSFINVGDRLPDRCDAVTLPDTVIVQGGQMQITATVAPAEGVLLAGGDASASQILCRAGTRLRASDVAVLRSAGIVTVDVRQPRVRIVSAGAGAVVSSCVDMLISLVAAEGGIAGKTDAPLASALGNADAIVTVGGTGMGGNDGTVAALARAGEVAFHGVALSPGETAAVGMIGARPVLLFPGRIDSTLACWLTLGRVLLRRLAGATESPMTQSATLSRKIASSIGMTDMVLVSYEDGKAEPLASGYWPMHALARANGFVVVPPGSEGHPSGATVAVSDLP